MTTSVEYEIDLREVFAALLRRWRWLVGFGLLGMTLVAQALLVKSRSSPQVQAKLIVDVAQLPSCTRQLRQINSFVLGGKLPMICHAEVDSFRLRLNRGAKNFEKVNSRLIGLRLSRRAIEKCRSACFKSLLFCRSAS